MCTHFHCFIFFPFSFFVCFGSYINLKYDIGNVTHLICLSEALFLFIDKTTDPISNLLEHQSKFTV